MSFNKKFLNKSPINRHGGPHNGQPNVKANTKAFSTPSDIMKKKVLEARQPEASLTKTLLSTANDVAKSLTPLGVVKNLYDSAKDVYSDYQKGDYKSLGKKAVTELAFNLAPYGIGKVAKPLAKVIKKSAKNININQIRDGIGRARAESKLLKNPNYTRVYTADGSSKIMEKSKTVNLNRIEDANVTNKVYKNPKTGYEDYNWANRVDKSDFQNIASKHYLDNTKRLGGSEKSFSTYNLGKNDNRRLISMYFDPKDAEKFSVFNSTKRAYEMSKNKANEFVIPPDIMKNIRSNKSGYGFTTTVGGKSKILEQMNKF